MAEPTSRGGRDVPAAAPTIDIGGYPESSLIVICGEPVQLEHLTAANMTRLVVLFACLGCQFLRLPIVVVETKHSAVVACRPTVIRHFDFRQHRCFSASKNRKTSASCTSRNANAGIRTNQQRWPDGRRRGGESE
ncbi:hypothetical protein HPB50_014538 [Hyalomma asiaticum]|uniref:Uncharacterized protein n=1 Tax=Hyalomma asiaticum TaxID=266040 RepID=A0ACB7S052_HYAAI|nr:hypothetical protein HPB50_014538 [Hyalomma asiaticum]